MPNDKPTTTTILGGTIFTAHYLDGTTEQVKIHQLTIRKLITDWLAAVGNDPKMVELYCAKEEGWADQITVDDCNEILRLGDQLNDPQFARWAERRRADIARIKELPTGVVQPVPKPSESNSPSSSSPAPSS